VALEEPVHAADLDQIDADGKGFHRKSHSSTALRARIAVVTAMQTEFGCAPHVGNRWKTRNKLIRINP
jgi:hypothetical protein